MELSKALQELHGRARWNVWGPDSKSCGGGLDPKVWTEGSCKDVYGLDIECVGIDVDCMMTVIVINAY